MNDDAIAPVVAVMMILVVVVTLLSIWNAIYLPDLKQQAEVEHLKEVEEGMLRFSNDIDNSIHLWRNGTQSESIPLGGGDFFLNNVRSGGELSITRLEMPVITISINGIPFPDGNGYISKVNYNPVSNFWIDQGYSWEKGTVNVTKGNVDVPISLQSQNDETTKNFMINLNRTPVYSNGDRNITLGFVNITPSSLYNTTSGNGISQLKLNATTVTVLRDQPDVVSLAVNGHELVPPSVDSANVTIERLDIILSVE
jgi:hypothetical protein